MGEITDLYSSIYLSTVNVYVNERCAIKEYFPKGV